MDIRLEDEQLKTLISQAIYQSLDEQKRAALIQAAIAHLLSPTTNSMGRKEESPLQSAFYMAASNVARETAIAMLKDDVEFQGKVRSLMHEVFDRLEGTKREAMVEELSSKLGEALVKGLGRDY